MTGYCSIHGRRAISAVLDAKLAVPEKKLLPLVGTLSGAWGGLLNWAPWLEDASDERP